MLSKLAIFVITLQTTTPILLKQVKADQHTGVWVI